jgi:hypothetical protein
MSVTNLSPKKRFAAGSVQPMVRSDYSAVTATTTISKLVRESVNRKEVMITNTSTANLYVAFSRLPSSTDYAILIPYNGILITETRDAINGVWASAAGGQANIVEEY